MNTKLFKRIPHSITCALESVQLVHLNILFIFCLKVQHLIQTSLSCSRCQGYTTRNVKRQNRREIKKDK